MEFSKLWKCEQIKGVELLKASFKQFQFSRHWHDELAVGIIEKGAEGLNYRGSKIIIPENHIVAINPAEVHTGFAGGEYGWTYRMFYFDTQLIDRHFSESPQSVLPFIKNPIIHDPGLFSLLYQLHVALEFSSFNLTKETLLALTFTKLFSRHGDSGFTVPGIFKESKSNSNIRDYLLENWQKNVTLDSLEELSGRSKYQLIRSFSMQYRLTPHQFLLLVKTTKAKNLLRGGRSCADTALECGFYDQSHMTRNFKRAFGVSPKRYSS